MKIGHIYEYKGLFEPFLEYIIHIHKNENTIEVRSELGFMDDVLDSYLDNSSFYTDIFEE
jgi:hypothetical protein